MRHFRHNFDCIYYPICVLLKENHVKLSSIDKWNAQCNFAVFVFMKTHPALLWPNLTIIRRFQVNFGQFMIKRAANSFVTTKFAQRSLTAIVNGWTLKLMYVNLPMNTTCHLSTQYECLCAFKQWLRSVNIVSVFFSNQVKSTRIKQNRYEMSLRWCFTNCCDLNCNSLFNQCRSDYKLQLQFTHKPCNRSV